MSGAARLLPADRLPRNRAARLFRNRGDGTFADVTREAGSRPRCRQGPRRRLRRRGRRRKARPLRRQRRRRELPLPQPRRRPLRGRLVVSGTGFGLRGQPAGRHGRGRGRPRRRRPASTSSWPTSRARPTSTTAISATASSRTSRSRRASACRSAPSSGFGLNLLDVENDGDLDAFIANGHISSSPGAGQ